VKAAPVPKLVSLAEYWSSKRGCRATPSRADFPVSELRPCIGNLAIIEVDLAARWRFRLCGTNLFPRFGGDVSGRYLDSLPADIVRSTAACVARTSRSKEPVPDHHARMIDGHLARFEETGFPLSDDNIAVNTVLFASFPTKAVPAK
jgi:hypothetical protein